MRLLWDLDGTLVDSVVDLQLAVNSVRALYRLPHASLEDIGLWIGDGAQMLLQRAGCEGNERDLLEFHRSYAATGYAGSQLFPGIRELLVRCVDKWGHSMAVVTNKPLAPTEAILDLLDIRTFFHHVHGGDTITKPNPQALEAGAQWVPPENCVMIGDHHTDLAAAKNFGCAAIWVAWGYGNHDGFDDPQSCATVDELSALLDQLPKRDAPG